ncbi:MAG TPA: alpha-D-ribose 1-methylphosphonate 5-triphosphate diphosphatase [Bosea sp. (in: a-proteobacteria)]|nr:alpha-D-ribose 1-methylphosphonate 5-triphosphate diphosphatase [Bosea sp. (in: a-proteobacteria)]
MALHITGGKVLGAEFAFADLTTQGSAIAAIDGSAPAVALRLDATGLLVLPGIVDIHGDAFERHIMPRPGVSFDIDVALRDADRAMLACGITTAFHGVTWSWEPGLRGAGNARALVAALERLRPRLGADTRFHLRHEIFNLEAEAEIFDWLGSGRIGVLAFNDHTPAIFKGAVRAGKIAKMAERTGLSDADFMALARQVFDRGDEVPASVARIAQAARNAGVPMLSHDDASPAMRRDYRALGVGVAEFPLTVETAREASAAGEAIVFGAPNVVRGGSHLGCPGAEEMVREGLCSILASDYYYPSLPLAPFILAGNGSASLPDAWRLVSQAPAMALGLADRGAIAPGMRADLVLVDEGPQPRVVATIVGGRLAHLADQRILAGASAAAQAA